MQRNVVRDYIAILFCPKVVDPLKGAGENTRWGPRSNKFLSTQVIHRQ